MKLAHELTESGVEDCLELEPGPAQPAAAQPSAPSLCEEYRPRKWADVVGQDVAVRRIRRVLNRGWGSRAWWLSGPSGTGKTTLARLIAAEGAAEISTVELDATELQPAALRSLEAEMVVYGWPPLGGRAYLVNEAHGLRRDTIQQLLVLLERLPRHVCFIFTTTDSGEQRMLEGLADAGPFRSRCLAIPLAAEGLAEPFARAAKQIAEAEGLNGQGLADYKALAESCKCNLRAMLQAVESGAMLEPGKPEPASKPRKPAPAPMPSGGEPVGGTCPTCGAAVLRPRKFCNVVCYTEHLKRNKKKR